MQHMENPSPRLHHFLFQLFYIFLMSTTAINMATAAPQDMIKGLYLAENSIQTSDGRIFISTAHGLYQLQEEADGQWSKSMITANTSQGAPSRCYYFGLAEYARTLYVLCAENVLNVYFTPKHLLALDLDTPAPQLRQVGRLKTTGIPNGLAADTEGQLYYASSGILYPGNIHRLTLSGRFTLHEDRKVLQFATSNPTGIKIDKDRIYISSGPVLGLGMGKLRRYPLRRADLGKPTLITKHWGFFDDFSLLTNDGILLTNFLQGRVLQIDEASGNTVQSLSLAQPTSAIPLRTQADEAPLLLVTQRGHDQATLLPNIGHLIPR